MTLRAACIHDRYERHKVDNPDLCEHGSHTMHVHNEWACAGPRNEWCSGGREVTIESQPRIVVSRNGGAIATPYNWTTFGLADGSYGLVRLGDIES